MNSFRYAISLSTVAACLLAGCASNVPAPVSERGPARSVAKGAAPVTLKPGEYMVKKGDTLRSIALEHGQDYKDIATWSNLENPNVISVGQVLRVAPPTGASTTPAGTTPENVEMRPVAPPADVQAIPLGGSAAAPATSMGGLKREPKGGTQPYSDDAWAQLQKPQAATAMPAAPSSSSSTTSQPASPADNATKTAASAANGDIAWQWPTTSPAIAEFSESTNKGIDFGGKVGDPVYAVAPGKVTLVTNSLRGYGNLIVIKHNATYLSVYAHNSRMLVTEGQSVTKGQKIAEVGSTDADRPKLHFEIRREGKPVDPGKYLPQR